MAAPTTQAPGYQRRRVGECIVTALVDGHFHVGHDVFTNVDEQTFQTALGAAHLPRTHYHTPVNAYVVHTGGKIVVVDTGAPKSMAETAGEFVQSLAAAGVSPAEVDTVLITHLHPDHVGNLSKDGAATFPNAALVVSEDDHAYWSDIDALPDAKRAPAEGAARAIAPYADRTTFVGQQASVAPGIDTVPLPGHTPGHTGYRIHSGGAQLLIWGDIVHVAPLQLPDPSRTVGYDISPETAATTRRAILDEVATDGLLVAGMHMPFPGFGHIERAREGYSFAPAPWQYVL